MFESRVWIAVFAKSDVDPVDDDTEIDFFPPLYTHPSSRKSMSTYLSTRLSRARSLLLPLSQFTSVSNIQDTATWYNPSAQSRDVTESHDIRGLLNAEKQRF